MAISDLVRMYKVSRNKLSAIASHVGIELTDDISDDEAGYLVEIARKIHGRATPESISNALGDNASGPCQGSVSRSHGSKNKQGQFAYVYLLHTVGAPLWKIGKSVDPMRRLASLQTGMPMQLRLLGQAKSGNPYGVERHLHSLYAAYRIGKTEWFSFPDDAVEEILRLLEAVNLEACSDELTASDLQGIWEAEISEEIVLPCLPSVSPLLFLPEENT